MKLFQRSSDGGKGSGVSGFWVCEFKSLFSIVFLRFSPGSRTNFHSHAFNAFTIWLKGSVVEERWDTGTSTAYPQMGRFKYTPRANVHKVHAIKPTYCVSFRGPWHKTWFEVDPIANEMIEMTRGRCVVSRRAV